MNDSDNLRLYIGTLYSNENEYSECIDSINAQSYKKFDHFILRNLPNKEAHVSLYKSFLNKADIYEILIKVDADMVLLNNNLFERIVKKFEENAWLDLFAIAVWDFFSDQLIWSLNAYRNTVRWNFENENLFVDYPVISSNKLIFDEKDLAPAAIHCKNPSPYQAFHYGVHRGLKVIQPDRIQKSDLTSINHWNTLERTWIKFRQTKDVRIGLASLGAELAFAGKFRIQDLDYGNPIMRHVLESYLLLDAKQLDLKIKKFRLLNWGILTGNKRRKLLCHFSYWSIKFNNAFSKALARNKIELDTL
jgi:hypothetical protein